MKGYSQKRHLQKVIGLVERNDQSCLNVVLNGFNMTDGKLAALAMSLVNNTHVRRLELDGNTISDQGASLLAYALQHNKTLEFVSLNDNVIRSAGAEAIATALYRNEALRILRLDNNSIGNHGAKKLRRMMKENESIRELHLDGNVISRKMAGKFDNRCKITHTQEPPAGCDSTAGSTAGSDFPSHASSDGDRSMLEEPKKTRSAKRGEEFNASIDLEWAASSALSLFGASRYMDDEDALKYIIGLEESASSGLDASSSWRNLATYMTRVQRTMNKQDNKEHQVEQTEKLDDLSVASEQKETQEGKHRKKTWSKLKRSLKKSHTQSSVWV